MAIGRVYFNQDLRPGVDGLVQYLQKHKLPVPKGDNMALFVNNSRTILKLLAGSGHLVTFKAKKGRVKLEDITSIRAIFQHAQLNSKATERQIQSVLGRGAQIYSEEDQLRIVG